jgi:heme A synthase
VGVLLASTLCQAALGITQSYLVTPAVPPVLVAIHMFGAASLTALLTFSWLTVHGKTKDSAF